MKKQNGELYYLEIKDMIPTKLKMTEKQRDFVNYYLSKLGVEIEEDPLIAIAPMDSIVLGSQILDIIIEYEKSIKKDS